VTYREGYLFDPPHAKLAFRKAARIAHAAGRKVALSLSDAFCVNRYRQEFLELVEHDIDILFANDIEITALFECELDQAIGRARHLTELAAVTRGADGSVLATPETVVAVPAAPVERVVDTTG
jgi:sugar/nucleoside kinase (ribokinase family)